VLPDSVLDELRQFKAIYLGAIGHPDVKPGILEKGILLRVRFELDQYINLRPVMLYPGVDTPLKDKGPEDIDFVVVRENTEGLYAGAGGYLKYGTPDEVAVQESINTRKGVDRCLKFAFELARKRNKAKKLTLVAKTNVLTFASDLWERAFLAMAKVSGCHHRLRPRGRHLHVDGEKSRVVRRHGDGQHVRRHHHRSGGHGAGGHGSGRGGQYQPPGVSMFEPIGGSAPKYTGLNKVNPIAAIAAAQMMLEYLGETKAARAMEDGIKKTATQMRAWPPAGWAIPPPRWATWWPNTRWRRCRLAVSSRQQSSAAKDLDS
jgi:3-isopropylmalate dehydrogenase